MDFELGRINRIINDLQRFIIKRTNSIINYKVEEGNKDGREKVDTSNWADYETGNLWGGYDQHMWFRTSFTMPEDFQGEHVVYRINTGHKEGWDISNPQFLCYLDGKIIQGLDVNHRSIVINTSAKVGEAHEVALLGYSGLKEEKVYLKTELSVIDLEIEDFYYNIKNVYRAACILDKEDVNQLTLVESLKKAANMLDLRSIYSEEFYAGLRKANDFLKAKFYTHIREGGPVVTTIGHTHIDIAWLWNVEQTKEKVVRSFSTVLNYMDQYPEYKFMSSQPQLYVFLKEKEPELYEKVKEKIAEGRWEVDGAMWLESDCNIPSGESLARQLLYGTRFIQEEFGKKCKTLWLPDVFGYSATLPQLLKKSGIPYFFTTKLDWNQFNKMPHDTFMWKGIDGSEVLTQLVTTTGHAAFDNEVVARKNPDRKTTYNGRLESNQVLGNWTRYQDKQLCEETLQPFGFGDGGGGPTEEQLQNFKRLKYGLPGIPKVQMDFQGNFFDRLNERVKDHPELAKWVGELYFECHRGTYTSMAKNKRNNRKSEFMYTDLETLSALSETLGGTYPKEEIRRGWDKILLNQFHDIIPGTCIEAVYDQTDLDYAQVFNLGTELIEKQLAYIASQIHMEADAVVVFNTLSFERDDMISFIPRDKYSGKDLYLKDQDGTSYPCQVEADGKSYISRVSHVPAKGYGVYTIAIAKKQIVTKQIDTEQKDADVLETMLQDIDMKILENPYYRLQFDDAYQIMSIWDKRAEREVVSEGKKANVLEIYEDRPMDFENWDIDIYYKSKHYDITQVENAIITEDGPVRTCLQITRRYYSSTIVQNIYLYHDNPRIDFKTQIDWHEHQVLLKAAFPVDIHADKATYDIQYGNVERNTHDNTSWDVAQFEVCAHKWADLSEEGYGISLLNDSKYGYDINNGYMRLTLIKCGQYPNKNADQGNHEFTYSLYPHEGNWKAANTQQQAYQLNVPLYTRVETAHIGHLSANYSMFTINKNNCVIEVVKKAEDSHGYILRVYEDMNKRTKAVIRACKPIKLVELCNLLEEKEETVLFQDNSFTLEIKPYEIKTYYIEFVQ